MSARAGDKLVLGGEPRVQLLPQSVRDREKAAATRRRLAMLVVLALVLVGGGYGFAWMRNNLAQQQLETARQATQSILTEQAQYAAGTRAAALAAGIESAQAGITAHEIPWDEMIDAISAMLPEGAVIENASLVAQSPWELPLGVEGPLRTSRIALLSLTFDSATVLDIAAIVAHLVELPGYVDSRFDDSVLTGDRYATSVRVMLDVGAATGRYADESATDGAGDADSASTETEGEGR